VTDVFPDVRWGSESARLRKPLLAFSASRAGSWVIRKLTPLDRRLLMRSRGRYTVLGPFAAPTMLLTTTGAKSGLPRTQPLLFARQGDSIVVVGSNFGQAHHPAWTGNLIATPRAVVTIARRPSGPATSPDTAEESTPGKRTTSCMLSVASKSIS
jgi:deazaflavin-dependent oxidoreductase (nitroreductase family)